jgi:hypothetical protein
VPLPKFLLPLFPVLLAPADFITMVARAASQNDQTISTMIIQESGKVLQNG